MLRQATHSLSIRANRPGLHEITDDVRSILSLSGISNGLATLFCRHTSASLLIQENAAPAARRDLERYFERIAPEDASYEHEDEGPDDMAAHARSVLAGVSLHIPVAEGRLALGTWQGVYLWEHRTGAHTRSVVVTLVG